MLKIACCDDSKKDRDIILNAIKYIETKGNVDFDTNFFDSGEKLIETIKEKSYDIILMDIVMDEMDGIETVRQIRKLGEESKIIFISSSDDRLKELFPLDTVAFLDKPLNMKEFEEVVERVLLELYNSSKRTFKYTYNKENRLAYIKDIKFFESKGQKIYINTGKEEIFYYGTIKGLKDRLKGNDEFVQINRSFVVNLKYVEVNKSDVKIIGTDVIIPISRGKKDYILEAFMTYLEKGKA